MISFYCGKCHQENRVSLRFTGWLVRCTECHTRVRVPFIDPIDLLAVCDHRGAKSETAVTATTPTPSLIRHPSLRIPA